MSVENKYKLPQKDWWKALNAWGPEVNKMIAQNPYQLCELKIFFKTADAVGQQLKIPKTDPRRTVALAFDLLELALRRDGHTCVHQHTLCAESGAPQELLAKDPRFVFEGRYVMLATTYAAESYLAEWIRGRV